MSTDTTGTTEVYDYYEESELRERFDEVVQGRAGKARALHLPDPESNDVEPLCDRPCSRGWRLVDIAAFPEGQFDHCMYCLRRLQWRDYHAPTPPSARELRWRENYGDALAAEWG